MEFLFKNIHEKYMQTNIFNIVTSFIIGLICDLTGNWWYLLICLITISIAVFGSMKCLEKENDIKLWKNI